MQLKCYFDSTYMTYLALFIHRFHMKTLTYWVYYPSVEASNVINEPKCNKSPKCNNVWP